MWIKESFPAWIPNAFNNYFHLGYFALFYTAELLPVWSFFIKLPQERNRPLSFVLTLINKFLGLLSLNSDVLEQMSYKFYNLEVIKKSLNWKAPSTNLSDTEWPPTRQQWRAKVSWWTVFEFPTSRTLERQLWKEQTGCCVFMCLASYIGLLGEIFLIYSIWAI